MRTTKLNRFLSLLLVLVMIMTLLPTVAFADAETWTKVEFEDIKDTDTVAITMSKGDATWLLPTTGEGGKKQPLAVEATITDGKLVTANSENYGWNISKVADTENGYYIKAGESYLYLTAENNGMRIGKTQSVWSLNADNYLTAKDSKDTSRYLGVYNNTDWRCYTNYTGTSNIAGQTLTFYKLDTNPYASIDKKYSVYEKVTEIADGDTVLVYNAGNSRALSSASSGYNLAGVDVLPNSDGYITLSVADTSAVEWTVGKTDSTYTFKQGDNIVLSSYVSTSNGKTYTNISTKPTNNTAWNLSICNEDNGSFYIYSTETTSSYGNGYIEWYADKSAFTVYATTTLKEPAYGMTFYKLVRQGVTDEPDEPDTAYTLTDSIASGDTVVMFNAGSNTLLSSTASGFKLSGVSATPESNVITTADNTVAWVVGVDADGNYTFTQGDKVLGTVKSGSYVNLSTNASDSYTAWTLESSTTDNVFYLKNTNMPGSSYGNYYIEYYNGYTAYATTSPSDSAFGISFYKLNGSTTPVEPTYNTIADGAYILWEATNYKAATALNESYNYGYLKTVDVSLSGGALSGYNKNDAWTITNVSDGQFTIQDANNKYLYLSGTYNSFNVSATVPTEGHLWKAVANSDGTYTITNVLKEKTISYDTTYGSFGAYASTSDTKLGALTLTKYVEPGIIANGSYVIYNASAGKAMSSEATGTYYRAGKSVTLTDGKVDNPTNDIIWNFAYDGENYVITTQDGNKLSMNDERNSLPLDEANSKWTVKKASTDGCYYLVNATRTGTGGDHYYVEWYTGTSKSGSPFEEFSTYFYSSKNEAIYAMQLIPAEPIDIETGDLPKAGDKVMIYNQNAKAVLAEEGSSQVIEKALATVTDGKITEVENGGVLFTVEKNGDYYRFYNETYGYLCSNGTGNNAFYSKDFSEEGVSTDDADWTVRTCSGSVGGYELESRSAKFNGKYSQWLEYYSDSFKTYSMYNVTDYTIYSFYFYPIDTGLNDKLVGGIYNDPKVNFTAPDAKLGLDYELTFIVDAPFGVQGSMVAKLGSDALTVTKGDDGVYTVKVPAEKLAGKDAITVDVSGKDTKNCDIKGSVTIKVLDEPSFIELTPAANSQTGDDKKPTISAKVINAGTGATVTMNIGSDVGTYDSSTGVISYTPTEDMADSRITVAVTVTRTDGSEYIKTWSFTVGKSQYQLYFGQLHSHTNYSDGSGSLETALSYVKNLPASANVQFVAFTDHSNYFDGSKADGTVNPEGALYDMSLASTKNQELWNSYKSTVAEFNKENSGSIVALAGFEMTWSGGPGHINTFNTPGIVSRNNDTLNNKTDNAGLQAYYSLLSQNEGADSISQFNHPGSTFGTFIDFSYWNAVIDSRIYLVEVGNGEGQIGAGGYYPSYEYYTMALDKGWHVAPTNNQDNHKGKWGNANDARDVILTDDFTEEGIYAALRALRVYSTEDKNLEITYTVNGEQLGSQIVEVPEKLNFAVSVFDPDSSDSISKVEIIVNSGKVAYTWDKAEDLKSGEFSVELDPDYSYYYIRVTQADGDLAVTAPVWVGESLKLGISDVKCSASTPVTGEELTLTTTFFNSENAEAKVKSITYTTNGSEVIGTDSTGVTISANSTGTAEFKYTPTKAKVMTITVTAVIEQDGKEYQFSKDIELDIGNADKLVYIGIDASHYNEYVAGNYKDSMGNFSNLAATYSVRTVELATSEDLIAACSNDKYKALILTAPSRRNGDALRDPYATYSDDEIAAIVSFNANGGTVILAGWSDHYENYTGYLPTEDHMAAQQNKILSALGSSLRISDDATYDDAYSAIDSCDAWRLYFNTYNFDNFLVDGVEVGEGDNAYNSLYTEKFSHYGGASIYTVDGTLPATVSPVVYAHSSTYSVDVDKDGLGGDSTPKYAYAEGDERLMIMASEQLEGKGLIVVSGAAFMSNFEVQATIEDNGSEKNYSNYKICENLLSYINPITITPIKDVQAEKEEGVKYTIEGVVTSNASGYDANTAFFDCIYVQDETAGINAFPVAGNYEIGDKVRITGTTSSYQGERQIAVSSIEKLGEVTPVEPTAATAKQINDGSLLGSLVKVSGTITKVEVANGLIQTILVKDKTGTCRLFIDGYITTSKDVEGAVVGANVEAVGLASYDNTFVLDDDTAMAARIRIRDRADIVCTTGSGSGSSVGSRANITLTANSAELKYNGSKQSVTGLVDNTFTYGGKVYTVTGLTVGANGTDAGTYNTAVSGRATVKDAQGNDLTRLFNIIVTPGTLTIAKRDVTLTSANAQKLYDGKALTADAVTATGDGFAEGEGAVFTVTGTQTQAGESANSFSYALTDATKAANYSITTVEGKLTVDKRSVTLTSASDSKSYDGKALTNDTVTVSGDGFAEGEGAVFTVTGKQTRIGESDNSFSYTLKPGTDAANYSITTVEGKLKVVNFPFTDVATNAWCFEAIDYLWRNEIVKGVSATEYDPDGTLSRAMFVTMLCRIAGAPDVSGMSTKFTDIDIDWAHDAIIWACNAKVTKGISATEFAPDLEIDRAMIVTMLYRFCGSPAVSGSVSFKDASDIPDYAKDAVIWATQNGIINGYTDNTFRPTNTATRAEAAAMLYRFITK